MFGLCFASTFVIAAVNVVLPWSMCPIVPTFTCGLLRSNFSFAIALELRLVVAAGRCPARFGPEFAAAYQTAKPSGAVRRAFQPRDAVELYLADLPCVLATISSATERGAS